ncbi:MAG TPA: hypothetical protein VEA99_18805 [Gemmatimonadaceae bacterium]|nr:hypothetical protein [Gemmatimonadaceae bacterium]
MLTRREFLAAAGAIPLAPLFVRRQAEARQSTASLRIVVLLEPTTAHGASMAAGARLARDETLRVVEMLGLRYGWQLLVWSGTLPRDVDVVVGGMTRASAARLSELAEEAGVVFLNVGSDDDALRGADCGSFTFHVAPSAAMRRDARRLARAGDAARVETWLPTLEAFGAAQLNDRFRHAMRTPMTSAAWAGWFAVKVATDAHLRRGTRSLRDALARDDARFDGHKGKPLSFRAWDRQLRQPLYVVPAGGGAPVEVPRRGGAGTAREQLDAVGTRAANSPCRRR